MDKTVLLVVLCLQAFLLITASPPLTAQQHPLTQEGTELLMKVGHQRTKRNWNCLWRPGGCGADKMVVEPPTTQPPTTKPKPRRKKPKHHSGYNSPIIIH